MQITLVALGTRGDVQPMLALGKGLQAAGHHLRIIAGGNFAAWVQSHGMEFVPTVDTEAMMRGSKGTEWAEQGNNQRRQLQLMKSLMDEYAGQMTTPICQSAPDSDLMISGFIGGAFVQSVSERYGITQINVPLQPYWPTRSGAATLITRWGKRNTIFNLWAGYFAERILWRIARSTANQMRTETLGLPAHTTGSYTKSTRHIPTIYGFSRYVVPRPRDWSDQVHIGGYWFLDDLEGWQPPEALTRFLDAGPPPVYIGFGSMSSSDPEAAAGMITEALRRTGQRGIILSGWSGAALSDAPENVLLLDKAPHSWLFPRLAGVVHHGGAGTTAAGLRAGAPTFIIPHMTDQPFWGRRVHELGVGPRPVPRHKLTVDNLADGIRALVSDSGMKAAAAKVGQQIRAENGIDHTVQLIEQIAAHRPH